MISTNL